MVFALIILFHPAFTFRSKTLYLIAYAALFLVVHIPWQIFVLSVSEFTYADWYRIGGASGFSYEFTPKNIAKSTAALLGIMWLFVPQGFARLRDAPSYQRLFAYISSPVPFIGYVWGFVSSRLLYVIAPPMLLISILAIRAWQRKYQIAHVSAAVALNLGWLVLSYKVTL
ncbi:MAG: hypothetical protein UY63_C0016G0016 [Parcubacteria group bacterium GW2011_GWA2_51_10]|nr:MAG: hypothetical protein UY63_C0016G0016 [Parcubacteria group bacterium GW2011_GWA2_51_10]